MPEQSEVTKKEEESPHLTEEEMKKFEDASKLETYMRTRAEYNSFHKMYEKPSKTNFPLTFDENGNVVRNKNPKEAPISKGNIHKGTLRNKKCSCGSGLKYKYCKCWNKFEKEK